MSTTKRFRLVLALVAVAALGFVVFVYIDYRGDESRLHTDDRMPVANPPVEPNRPDLLEEPRIEE
jgi:hypothetical protein